MSDERRKDPDDDEDDTIAAAAAEMKKKKRAARRQRILSRAEDRMKRMNGEISSLKANQTKMDKMETEERAKLDQSAAMATHHASSVSEAMRCFQRVDPGLRRRQAAERRQRQQQQQREKPPRVDPNNDDDNDDEPTTTTTTTTTTDPRKRQARYMGITWCTLEKFILIGCLFMTGAYLAGMSERPIVIQPLQRMKLLGRRQPSSSYENERYMALFQQGLISSESIQEQMLREGLDPTRFLQAALDDDNDDDDGDGLQSQRRRDDDPGRGFFDFLIHPLERGMELAETLRVYPPLILYVLFIRQVLQLLWFPLCRRVLTLDDGVLNNTTTRHKKHSSFDGMLSLMFHAFTRSSVVGRVFTVGRELVDDLNVLLFGIGITTLILTCT